MANIDSHRAAEAMVRSLGVTCANENVCQFVYALELIHTEEGIIHDMGRLDALVAQFYPEKKLNGGNIERNLRVARDFILKTGDPERLKEVMGYLLRRRPSVANMLDALNYYMECEGLWPIA